ncbi:DUF6146 family protein [Mesonia ostreae]|uniref:DUF6146 family protein n=1 Tax=Mesonia ostreae TaxID=861110 RepID=A0ABU2KHP5_9FLAO|nr:DUF6146 family protein [Mesonia ostreae]MDT0294225.1 DUF6146 family protein [Mesonia ostreae]
MKNFIYICVLIFAMYSCSSTAKLSESNPEVASNENKGTLTITNNNLAYEIIIGEPGYNAWLSKQQPKNTYHLNFLEKKNASFSSSYNDRVANKNYNQDFYPWEINYDPNLKYGLEVNYSLYTYFLYFQEKYNQTL